MEKEKICFSGWGRDKKNVKQLADYREKRFHPTAEEK